MAEALGLVLAQAQELARCGGWGGVLWGRVGDKCLSVLSLSKSSRG